MIIPEVETSTIKTDREIFLGHGIETTHNI